MKKYHIICHLTANGWQIEHDYSKMEAEPIRMQRDFQTIIDTLSEKMTKRDDSPTQFKIKLSFVPCKDRRFYRQTIDYSAAKYCPADRAACGMDLYNILCEELYK